MARYDFTSLSSQDLEELVRDLLQAHWNVALEAFRAGRDEGIDLRYSPADGGTTIIQCKHFVGSGFSKLLSHLVKSERPKIESLRPSRYVVATSVALTPGNKDDIAKALHPFVTSTADVIGAGDLEGLLAKYPDVERAHFKLWLTSTSVIDRVLHNAEVCHTEFETERIRRKLPLFVQGDAFPRAMRLLDESRVAVISGAPGIGETTLAEMMLYTHLEQGFEPVVIQADISEGKKFFRPDAKRIFYFDDFLGQFFLGDRGEDFGRNQDMAIVEFIEMVRASTHSRFILTTREHLFKSALLLSERLARSTLLENHCILELREADIPMANAHVDDRGDLRESRENRSCRDHRTAFLAADHRVEVARLAVDQLGRKRALDDAAAEGARQCPTRAATVLAAVAARRSGLGCSRARAELGGLRSARLATAVLEFPAVRLGH